MLNSQRHQPRPPEYCHNDHNYSHQGLRGEALRSFPGHFGICRDGISDNGAFLHLSGRRVKLSCLYFSTSAMKMPKYSP